MAASPASSDRPSPTPFAPSQDADNTLQPFFVLHKAQPRVPVQKAHGSGRTRRKIDLTQSPPDPDQVPPLEASGPVYEQLRLEAFERTWSKIDATIKVVLRDINLKLFDELLQWVQESFSALKSRVTAAIAEIRRPYPIVTDTIGRKIPTSFVFTRNAEFVDDIQAFSDLSTYLSSNGCHVANLSALDFMSKHRVGGSLRTMLRQLVSEAADADMSILASWYCEEQNYDKPIIVIIDNMEQCCGAVLGQFIALLSEWVIKVPVFFVMGVSTTVDAPRKLLSADALQRLQPCKLSLGSPDDRMNSLIEAVLVRPCSGFSISHKVALFLRDYFQRHDGTITSFISALKLACSKHFSEPLSFVDLGIHDENPELLEHMCNRSTSQDHAFRGKTLPTRDGIIQGLSELRKLQSDWSSVVMCLFEAGRRSKMQLLDLFCEASDPSQYRLRTSEGNLQTSLAMSDNYLRGMPVSGIGRFITQTIYTVRELSMAELASVLKMWSIHTKEMNKINKKVKELQSIAASTDGGWIWKDKGTDAHKRSVSAGERKGACSLNDKAASLLGSMVRKFLTPIECVPFFEVICFGHVDELRMALIGDPRRTIQLDLLKPQNYLHCSCCSRDGNSILSSMHDSSIMYHLAQEYGDIINLHDWYQSFKANSNGVSSKPKRKSCHSPASQKRKAAPSESEAMIQARFCRAVSELQIAGLLRMPSKRRPDFVQRVAFGL